MSVESEALTALLRVDVAIAGRPPAEQAAARPLPFDYNFAQVIEAWEDPPIQVEQIKSPALLEEKVSNQAFANINPEFMLQFRDRQPARLRPDPGRGAQDPRPGAAAHHRRAAARSCSGTTWRCCCRS